ncbi:uncharacterized protein B0H18DRAFT_1043536 [Fomitopsis serialis]|uniref:uncharacterized protein n=1 Tax=Fomitopsis serialis TaxID=139415 RepID=UPI002008A0C1|nr:uncharacterized protein B0H18DRAFT_1043536 [Neoantrodia serialis]KAH9914978.1 hypothetical protein B0H18DRAFT_1043536 [Neoantrodia serialis]
MDAVKFFHVMFPFMDASRSDRAIYYEPPEDQKVLLTDFERELIDYHMYFNHFVVVPRGVLQLKYLHALLARGAAVRCEQLDCPIDAVLPMVEGGRAEKGKANLILLKAVTSSDGRPAEEVFRAMDPYALDIWAPDYAPNKPLIRIVFAFDVPREDSCFRIAKKENVDDQQRMFVSYDIWIAGLSPALLGSVNPDTAQEMREILLLCRAQRTRLFPDPHSRDRVPVMLQSFSLRAGGGARYQHWQGWTEDML